MLNRLSRWALAISGLLAVWAVAPARGDEFDRLDGPALAAVPDRFAAQARERLTLADLGGLPRVLRGFRTPLVVVKTGEGNLARLLVASALRKPPGGRGEPVPVLVLERFATFEAGRATTRLARGQDVLLFDGFRFDLESGQVVPDGQGGDVQLLAGGPDGPRLVALDGAKLYPLTESPLPEPPRRGAGPSPGRAVLPGDFAGRFRLFVNGQMSGSLELEVGDRGAVSGQFRSDLRGSIYPVAGQVSADVPQQVRFAVKFPRSRQDFEGYLWTEGKNALAGTVTMLDRPYGFFALREGSRLEAAGVEVASPGEAPGRPGRLDVTLLSDHRYRIEGRTLDTAGFAAALKQQAADVPNAWVLLHVPADQKYSDVARAIEVVQSAGISSLRLAPRKADPNDDH